MLHQLTLNFSPRPQRLNPVIPDVVLFSTGIIVFRTYQFTRTDTTKSGGKYIRVACRSERSLGNGNISQEGFVNTFQLPARL